MGYKFAELMFTEDVKKIQEQNNSREMYEKFEQRADRRGYELTPSEAAFIQERDSFYMASVNKNGWPYVQHRGGSPGFVKVIDAHTIAFADYTGNRQYVSTGNFMENNRVSLFFMNYTYRQRLKLLGYVSVEDADDYQGFQDPDYNAKVERVFVIRVEAVDWNCPKYITPRYTQSQLDQKLAELKQENERLQQVIAELAFPPVQD